MLDRVLEPEVMDTAEEARDYDSMDHSHVNRIFAADFLAAWNRQNPILDVGTGTAQIPIEICQQSPDTLVTGIDLSEQMLKIGRDNVQKATLGSRITVKLCDAKGLPFSEGAFGSVISNSIIHHIPEPANAFGEMVRVTRQGGCLFVRDLLRPPTRETLIQLVALYAGDANAHQQKMFAESLHAALSLDEVRSHVTALGFRADTVQATTDRHWTWSAVKP